MAYLHHKFCSNFLTPFPPPTSVTTPCWWWSSLAVDALSDSTCKQSASWHPTDWRWPDRWCHVHAIHPPDAPFFLIRWSPHVGPEPSFPLIVESCVGNSHSRPLYGPRCHARNNTVSTPWFMFVKLCTLGTNLPPKKRAGIYIFLISFFIFV